MNKVKIAYGTDVYGICSEDKYMTISFYDTNKTIHLSKQEYELLKTTINETIN